MSALAEALVAAQAGMKAAMLEVTTAIFEGTDTDRKIALDHLLEAYGELCDAVETPF